MQIPLLRVSFAALYLLIVCGCASVTPTQPILATTSVDGKLPQFDSREASSFYRLDRLSDDPEYGYHKEKPIKVGGGREGPINQRKYLSSLTGPHGEPVQFHRVGSCCRFEDPSLPMGAGLLDVYEVRYAGQTSPVRLYLNMYQQSELFIPLGFLGR